MEQMTVTPKKFSFCKGIKLTPSSTPKISKSINFAASLRKKNAFYLLPQNNSTPSPTSIPRVVKNPFEIKTSSLRYPLISSPSLFQHAQTPKKNVSEEQEFLWDIDEVSCINPANFHPHETQFKERVDPESEARAQAAITTFFSEHQIAPSPISCQLRKQKIVFKDDSFTSLMIVNSTAVSPRKNDVGSIKNPHTRSTQTTLTFPPDLPKEIEDVLQKYCIFNEDQQSSYHNQSMSPECNKSTMDISTLRRKLFENKNLPNDIDSDGPESPLLGPLKVSLSPPPISPLLGLHHKKSNLEMNDTFNSDMFGELSPISRPDSPQEAKKMKNGNGSMMSIQEESFLSQSTLDTDNNENRKVRISRKGKLRGKNLSTSFVLLQSEMEGDEKENHVIETTCRSQLNFQRTDSGFNEETNSNFSYMEHFETVDEMPKIKDPLKVLGKRLVLKNRNEIPSHENFCQDVSMQSDIDFNY